jgi:hypothetical protein
MTRLMRDEARADLRSLRITRVAVSSVMDKGGRKSANDLDKLLVKLAAGDVAKESPTKDRDAALSRIASLVARRKLDQSSGAGA